MYFFGLKYGREELDQKLEAIYYTEQPHYNDTNNKKNVWSLASIYR